MPKVKDSPGPALPEMAPLPSEWKVGNCRYQVLAWVGGWYLKTWRGGHLASALWFADEADLREAVQETKRTGAI